MALQVELLNLRPLFGLHNWLLVRIFSQAQIRMALLTSRRAVELLVLERVLTEKGYTFCVFIVLTGLLG